MFSENLKFPRRVQFPERSDRTRAVISPALQRLGLRELTFARLSRIKVRREVERVEESKSGETQIYRFRQSNIAAIQQLLAICGIKCEEKRLLRRRVGLGRH